MSTTTATASCFKCGQPLGVQWHLMDGRYYHHACSGIPPCSCGNHDRFHDQPCNAPDPRALPPVNPVVNRHFDSILAEAYSSTRKPLTPNWQSSARAAGWISAEERDSSRSEARASLAQLEACLCGYQGIAEENERLRAVVEGYRELRHAQQQTSALQDREEPHGEWWERADAAMGELDKLVATIDAKAR